MIKATQFYEIDPEQIEAIAREKQNGDHPYALKIITKSNHTYHVNYASESDRERDINKILAEIRRAKNSTNLTLEVIRWAVAGEIDKLRPYLRRMEKILKATEKEETTT